MKVIKKINNNYALAIDNSGDKVIIYGKGVGFKETPYNLTDERLVQEKYQLIDKKYISLFDSLDKYIIDIATKVVELGKKYLNVELNPNIIFTLADHINFAMYRYDNEIDMHNPMNSVINVIYPTETKIGMKALEIIKNDTGIEFPTDEACAIALHFVNAENGINDMYETTRMTEIIEKILEIISTYFHVILNSDSLEYSRFILHMRYLMVRRIKGIELNQMYSNLYDTAKKDYPQAYDCALLISEYLRKEHDWNLSKEEIFYILLHINRLIKL
ncbi:MAG: PRD domain-containing protein [Erysipelotrichia bacterium]|nr:PRD domain-containing protein [Erysipelotrichia bacterium]